MTWRSMAYSTAARLALACFAFALGFTLLVGMGADSPARDGIAFSGSRITSS